jgi:ribulose 1,5-bisphosphate synthetase/thiazole synthase
MVLGDLPRQVDVAVVGGGSSDYSAAVGAAEPGLVSCLRA